MSKNAKKLVFSAMCVALATVTSMIKVFEFPTGGAITLCSMLFGALPGYFFGPVTGLISGIAYGILQFILGPYVLHPVQVILDYGAFAMLGLLAGFFSNKKHGLTIGYIAGCAGRWVFSFLSGWVFFGSYAWKGWNAAAYSAVYNIIYIGAECIITLIIINIPAVSRGLKRIRVMAQEDDTGKRKARR